MKKKTKQNVINFKLLTLKEFYYYYHKKQWCYNEKYKHYKRQTLLIDALSTIPIIISATTAITLTPITTIISILCPAIQWIKKKTKWSEKTENFKQSTILLNKILADLRKHLREESCDINKIINELATFDEKILDIVKIPNIEKYEKKYCSLWG